MNFYGDAAKRILQLELNIADAELSARLQEAHSWLMVQHKAWCDLEARMSEKACGMPKVLSEDRKREQIVECLELMERGEPQTGAAALSAFIEASPEKPKLRGWYKRSQIGTLEESQALDEARMRPARIANM